MVTFDVKGKPIKSDEFKDKGIHYLSLPIEELTIVFDAFKTEKQVEEGAGEDLLLWFFQNVVVNEKGEKYQNMQTMEDIEKQELFVLRAMLTEFMFHVLPIDKKKL